MNYFLIISGVIGYLLGSANTSIIVGKFYGIDVRQHGSGNAGATNTLRTLGKKAAILVGLGDVLKGILSYLIGYYLVKALGGGPLAVELGGIVGGVCSIVGHNWPLYFKFKGGKGIFTSFAVVIMMDWKIALALFGLFLIIVAITRYVSLGSVVAITLFPIAAIFIGKSTEFIVFAFILAALADFKHRSNIVRLLNGTESKLGKKKTA